MIPWVVALVAFFAVLWIKGFGPEDRELFKLRKSEVKELREAEEAAMARDQILRQMRQHAGPTPPGISGDDLNAMLGDLRAEIASDRERDLQNLAESMAEMTTEYGERRETDGYLSGMRTATTGEPPPEANVRALRRSPKR